MFDHFSRIMKCSTGENDVDFVTNLPEPCNS